MSLIEAELVLHEIGQLSLAWEYGQAVSDCYEIVKKAPKVNAIPVGWIEENAAELERMAKSCSIAGAEQFYTIRALALWTLIKRWDEEEEKQRGASTNE